MVSPYRIKVWSCNVSLLFLEPPSTAFKMHQPLSRQWRTSRHFLGWFAFSRSRYILRNIEQKRTTLGRILLSNDMAKDRNDEMQFSRRKRICTLLPLQQRNIM